MPIDSALQHEVDRLLKRIRVLLVEKYSVYGLSIGCIAASIMILLSPKYLLLLDYVLWAMTVVVGLVAGCVVGLTFKIDNLSVVIAADDRSGLRERLSTAYVVAPSEDRPVDTAVIDDALQHIRNCRERDIFPHKFGLPHLVLCTSLLIFGACVFVPQSKLFKSKTRQQEMAVMRTEGKKLVKVAKEIKHDVGKREEIRKLAAKLEALGKKMQTQRMDRKTSMLKTEQLTKEFQREQDKLAKANAGKKSMEQAQSEMRKSSTELAQRAAEKMAQNQKIPVSEAVKKLASDKRLAELARKESPLTESEKKELSESLKRYTNPQNSQPIPNELGEALAKLAQNKDYQDAMEIMKKLAQKLNSGSMNKADKESLQKQMEELAKALKDTDLDELAKQMKENARRLAKMTPEEMKQMAKKMQEHQEMAKAMCKACESCNNASMMLGQCGLNPGSQVSRYGTKTPNHPEGAPRKLPEVDKSTKMATQSGKDGAIYSAGESTSPPDLQSPGSTSYTKVVVDAKKSAESALSRSGVPPTYRKRVKDYFSSLE